MESIESISKHTWCTYNNLQASRNKLWWYQKRVFDTRYSLKLHEFSINNSNLICVELSSGTHRPTTMIRIHVRINGDTNGMTDTDTPHGEQIKSKAKPWIFIFIIHTFHCGRVTQLKPNESRRKEKLNENSNEESKASRNEMETLFSPATKRSTHKRTDGRPDSALKFMYLRYAISSFFFSAIYSVILFSFWLLYLPFFRCFRSHTEYNVDVASMDCRHRAIFFKIMYARCFRFDLCAYELFVFLICHCTLREQQQQRPTDERRKQLVYIAIILAFVVSD